MKALERGRLLIDIGRAIRANVKQLAELEQAEAGKPAYQAPFEVEAAAQYFEFYGGLVPTLGGETLDIGPGSTPTRCASPSAWWA